MAIMKLALLSRRRGWPWQGKSQKDSQDGDQPKRPRAKKPSTSGPACTLCYPCSRLDLESMFTRETIEQALGPLSNFTGVNCGLCILISDAIASTWGTDWSVQTLCDALDSPPKLFMQSRSPMKLTATDGLVERPQPRLLFAVEKIPKELEQQHVVVNKEVTKIKNRHIIGEVECIPDPDVPLSILADTYVTRRELSPAADAELAKEWLAECGMHKHSKTRTQKGSELLFKKTGFRLIDVEVECLVEQTDRCDYVALSYVWGSIATILSPDESSETTPVLLTTRENVKRLSKPRGLEAKKVEKGADARVANTVQDAMEFTRQLGVKYLWVDTLCIVQDDPDDKGRLIGRMDDVYAGATVTLVAASGIDANAGLRGVTVRPENRTNPIKIPLPSNQESLNLAICLPSLSELVRDTRWNTRGWTFQEQALSQRCLHFTSTELFFSCSEAQFREGYSVDEQESQIEMRTGPPWWTRNLRKDPDPTPYRYLGDSAALGATEYQAAVQDYMRKDLTYSDDILNAFEGVFNRFNGGGRENRLSIQETQGIPAHLLYLGLLWFPTEEATKRPELTNPKEGALSHFSSWSWASWLGPVEFVFGESEWVSRNISYALRKRYQMHVPTIHWHLGGSFGPQTTHSVWDAEDKGINSDELSNTKTYLKTRIGVDIDKLHTEEPAGERADLLAGELGFHGAYLTGKSVMVSPRDGKAIVDIHNRGHYEGEFRFDSELCDVDEFVLILSAETIRKPADTQSTLLGVVTKDGVSKRVGVGFIYHSQEPPGKCLEWEYRYFTLR